MNRTKLCLTNINRAYPQVSLFLLDYLADNPIPSRRLCLLVAV